MGAITDGRSQKYGYRLISFYNNSIVGSSSGAQTLKIYTGNTEQIMICMSLINVESFPVIYSFAEESDKEDMSDALEVPYYKIVAPSGANGGAAVTQFKADDLPISQVERIGVYNTKKWLRLTVKGDGGTATNVTGVIYAVGEKFYQPTVGLNETGLELSL